MSAATRTVERLRGPRRPSRLASALGVVAPAVVARVLVRLDLASFQQMIAVVVAALALVLVARRPAAALAALLVLLPFQLPLTALLYRLGVTGGVTRMAALWKELVVLALVVAAWRRSQRRPGRFDALDRCAAGFVVLGTAYLALPGALVGGLGADVSLDARFLAWRVVVLPSVLLLATRRLRLTPHELRRVLRGATAMAALLGVAAVVEVTWSDWWNRFLVGTIGVNRYRVNVLDVDLTSQGLRPDDIRVYGEVAGRQIVRAGGPMTSHLTFSFLLLVALAVLVERVIRTDTTPAVVVGLVGCSVGLVATQTRSSIVGAVVLVVVVLWAAPGRSTASRARYGTLVATAAIVGIPLLLTSGLGDRFTHGDPVSDDVHAVHVDEALRTVEHHPLGLGLGMGSTAGGRAPTGSVSVENQPLDTAVQLGVLGSALLIAQYGLLVVALGRAGRRAGPTAQLGAFAVRTALLALLVPLWYQQAFGLIEVAWVLFALGGAALGAAEGDRARIRSGAAAGVTA